jgi:hypothetical protein
MYDFQHLTSEEGEADFLVRTEDGEMDVLELEFVDDLMTLRATDIDGFEHVWQTTVAFLVRGAPTEALEG